MGKKFTIEQVIDVVESIGGKIVENQEYINNKSPLKLICADCGKEFVTTFDSIKSKKKENANLC